MHPIRFLMIGGFLGAGKTTAIARLARHYLDAQRKVGVVTNDQAYDLVDTQALRAQGFRVGEVPGACFCCKFDDLVNTAAALQKEELPELILAEPVGSCTDLVATVIEPLRQLYGEQYAVGPLAVLLKPEHGRKILRNQPGTGFSPKAAYIFLKQIEEADIVVINKVDKLSVDQRDELVELVQARFPGKQVLAISARTGDQFDALIEALEQTTAQHHHFMDVDYDVYAEGEAELGWLNCQVAVDAAAGQAFALDRLLLDLAGQIRDALIRGQAEPAHLKVLGHVGDQTGIANLVGSAAQVELSLESHAQTENADLIVNARVAVDPETLESIVREALATVAGRFGLSHRVDGMQRFRPGRPVPTHRMQSGYTKGGSSIAGN